MPTYDYQCRSCGVITEVVHSMLEDGPTTCDRCGGELRLLVHPTGIIFKGSGFYKNDSRSSSSGSVGGGGRNASSSSSETSGSPGTTSTDAKSGDKSSDKGSGSSSGGADAAKGSPSSD